ncbi:MAG: ABC transporter substrate-binding protein [Eubacteriales bacterium]|nr:ABC transporter substrate-binding protein [Eubacteriales bacterium]
MKLKKITAGLLACAMVVSLSACGSSNGGSETTAASGAGAEAVAAESATVEQQMEARGIEKANSETGNTQTTDETLVVQLNSMPDNLWHPGAAANGANEEQVINAALLDRLVDLDENTNEVVPMLASSWEWVSDTELKFHLRDDVTMTDGTPLVADDVVYTANVWKENCASNDTGAYIDSATAEDEHTVVIKYNVVAPEILKMMTWANFGIVSEDEVNALGGLEAASKNPVMGSGKYRFKEWKSGEYVLLERNDNYWDKDYKGYFKEIKLTAVSDSGAKASSVQSGDAQVAFDMPVSQAATFGQNPEVRTYVYSNGEIEHLFFNMSEGHATSDIRVRQAIAKALNYDAIAQVASAGFSGKAYSYAAPEAPYYNANYTEEDMARDIEGAKALLAEAGYADGLEISTVTLPDLADLYTVIQGNLAEVGITLKIENVDMGAFVPAMLQDKSYDIVAVGDAITFRTPQLPQFVREGVVFGGPAVVLPEHEEILTKLMQAKTDDEAKELLAQYDAKNKEDVMCTNLYGAYRSSLTGKDIKGFAIRERGYADITTLYK